MYKKKSLSNLILLVLEKTVDGIVRYDDLIHHSRQYAWGGRWDYPLNKSALSNALKRLRENGLIDFINDKQLILRLTDKGREKALVAKLLLDDSKWDGKWRIVMFDIPEKRRIARDVLRQRLKSWGFVLWQQSVWVTKKDCTKLLREFIKSIGIKDWVKVVESDNVE